MNDDLLLLDTHIWLWAQLGMVDELSRGALSAIRRAESAGRLRVSVISIWELGRRGFYAPHCSPKTIG